MEPVFGETVAIVLCLLYIDRWEIVEDRRFIDGDNLGSMEFESTTSVWTRWDI